MVSVTIKVDYFSQGKNRSCEITARAQTYKEAYNKAIKAVKEFKENNTVNGVSVSRIDYK